MLSWIFAVRNASHAIEYKYNAEAEIFPAIRNEYLVDIEDIVVGVTDRDYDVKEQLWCLFKFENNQFHNRETLKKSVTFLNLPYMANFYDLWYMSCAHYDL